MQKIHHEDHEETTLADRKNLLGRALAKVECDCHLKRLVLWVFDSTAGGTAGELNKTHQDLAARPWGLCCSASMARKVMTRARSLGLIAVTEHRDHTGGQQANGYTIDWAGVRRLLGTQSAPARSGDVKDST